jgi:hypothetical protein
MSQTTGETGTHDPAAELPPVEPPTAGFIVQLFVIPALVVAVVVVVWLLFGRLAGGERDAFDYVQRIKSENENRRWRDAYELASLIQNDAKLASDPALLGRLTELLESELTRARKDENAERLAQYLALAIGAFKTLDARSTSGAAADPLASLAHALAPDQPLGVRVFAAQSLGRLGAEFPSGLKSEAATDALAKALTDPEPELRQRAAYSLGYVRGEKAAEALRACVRGDEDRVVRYNAAVALARRGDPAARDVLREMLSQVDLAQVIKGATESESKSRIEAIELEALWALQNSVKDGQPALAEGVRADVANLAKSGPSGVKVEAEALLKKLPAGR